MEELFFHCPRITVKPEFERLVRNGNELHPDQVVVEQMFPGSDASAQAVPCREEGEDRRLSGSAEPMEPFTACMPSGRRGEQENTVR